MLDSVNLYDTFLIIIFCHFYNVFCIVTHSCLCIKIYISIIYILFFAEDAALVSAGGNCRRPGIIYSSASEYKFIHNTKYWRILVLYSIGDMKHS